jgi:hypothetical protein
MGLSSILALAIGAVAAKLRPRTNVDVKETRLHARVAELEAERAEARRTIADLRQGQQPLYQHLAQFIEARDSLHNRQALAQQALYNQAMNAQQQQALSNDGLLGAQNFGEHLWREVCHCVPGRHEALLGRIGDV